MVILFICKNEGRFVGNVNKYVKYSYWNFVFYGYYIVREI